MNGLKKYVAFFIGVAILVSASSLTLEAQEEASQQQLEKLNAFARTYGYVRFFHPSDQASLVDWNKMALYGANEVLNSPDDESAEQVLKRVFDPVVVDLEFYRGEQKPLPKTKNVPIREVLAWQHAGVGIGKKGLYRSARTNRAVVEKVATAPFANVLQAVDANGLRGKEIRFTFQAKVDSSTRVANWC